MRRTMGENYNIYYIHKYIHMLCGFLFKLLLSEFPFYLFISIYSFLFTGSLPGFFFVKNVKLSLSSPG